MSAWLMEDECIGLPGGNLFFGEDYIAITDDKDIGTDVVRFDIDDCMTKEGVRELANCIRIASTDGVEALKNQLREMGGL